MAEGYREGDATTDLYEGEGRERRHWFSPPPLICPSLSLSFFLSISLLHPHPSPTPHLPLPCFSHRRCLAVTSKEGEGSEGQDWFTPYHLSPSPFPSRLHPLPLTISPPNPLNPLLPLQSSSPSHCFPSSSYLHLNLPFSSPPLPCPPPLPFDIQISLMRWKKWQKYQKMIVNFPSLFPSTPSLSVYNVKVKKLVNRFKHGWSLFLAVLPLLTPSSSHRLPSLSHYISVLHSSRCLSVTTEGEQEVGEERESGHPCLNIFILYTDRGRGQGEE